MKLPERLWEVVIVAGSPRAVDLAYELSRHLSRFDFGVKLDLASGPDRRPLPKDVEEDVRWAAYCVVIAPRATPLPASPEDEVLMYAVIPPPTFKGQRPAFVTPEGKTISDAIEVRTIQGSAAALAERIAARIRPSTR